MTVRICLPKKVKKEKKKERWRKEIPAVTNTHAFITSGLSADTTGRRKGFRIKFLVGLIFTITIYHHVTHFSTHLPTLIQHAQSERAQKILTPKKKNTPTQRWGGQNFPNHKRTECSRSPVPCAWNGNERSTVHETRMQEKFLPAGYRQPSAVNPLSPLGSTRFRLGGGFFFLCCALRTDLWLVVIVPRNRYHSA